MKGEKKIRHLYCLSETELFCGKYFYFLILKLFAGYRGRQGGAYPPTDSYHKPMFSSNNQSQLTNHLSTNQSLARKSYTLTHGYRGGRARNFSGDARSALDYASDTEAVQSPPSRSLRNGRLRSTGSCSSYS